ncbi:MAG: glycoside hydrolase family 3 C-terminal domain-containing protein [Streptosporangiaceae bacterium]
MSHPLYRDTRRSFAERAAHLVSCMTLGEKIAQLRTNSAPAIAPLGVQQYTYWSEGQHGINRLGANTDHGGATGGVHATSFPVNLAAAMSWDPVLIHAETTAISDEARGFLDRSLWGTAQNNIGPSAAGYGCLTYWAPTVNLDRDPRWGRTDEAFGEDPYLTARMAGAFVAGYQGQTLDGRPLTAYLKAAATAKHYALNNVENNRLSGSSDTDDANIRDYYTAQFRSLIEEAHVAGLMTAYNAVNGVPAVADSYTVNELAQRTYGFAGYITSDCGAVATTYLNSPFGHDWAPPGWTTDSGGMDAVWTNAATGQQVSGQAGGQAYALRAGTQLNCTGPEPNLANIRQAVDAGILSENVIDTALVHVFTVRMATGEFDPPSSVAYTRITKSVIQSPEHQALAAKVAASSLVLLKNNDVPGSDVPLLPARPEALNKVVIVGDLAGAVTLGGYSGDPARQVSAVQGITAAVQAASPGATVVYDPCATSTTASTQAQLAAQTIADIRNADLVIVFVGTDENVAREGHDRASLAMPGNYGSLISQVTAVGNPRMVLAIQACGPVEIGGVQRNFPAIVFSGYNGESQGTALASVLFGGHNPSGHLNFTWYAGDQQLPDMQNYGLTPSQTGGLGRTYMYFTGTPTYPFGYGLSYTTFAYSSFEAGPESVTPDGSVRVGFDVTNTGGRPGATVAQLYVANPFTVPEAELPARRLRGFRKTAVLEPGETEHITLTVEVSSLSFWDSSELKQVVYPGPYRFEVGYDSTGIAVSGLVGVTGTLTPRVRHVTVQPDRVILAPGETLDLTGKNPWITGGIVAAVLDDQSFADPSRARLGYRSSDHGVATVGDGGTVTAAGTGVATVSVSVDGVTGSAVIVVRQPFTLTAPAIVAPGVAVTVSTALPNTGSSTLRDVDVALSLPPGWTAVPASPASSDAVAPGQTAIASWAVTAPAGAAPAGYQLTAQATFTGPTGRARADAVAQASVPYGSLAQAYGNPGISDDADPSAGNLDGGGRSYSAQALAAAGLTRGARITRAGVTFTWPDTQPGRADNVVAGGQVIALRGAGQVLGVLGTGIYGTAAGTMTVTWTDGGTQDFRLSLADWWANAAAHGSDILATLPYINTAAGRQNRNVGLYCATLPLPPGRTVAYVTLPDISAGAASGRNAMHIVALAIGG